MLEEVHMNKKKYASDWIGVLLIDMGLWLSIFSLTHTHANKHRVMCYWYIVVCTTVHDVHNT